MEAVHGAALEEGVDRRHRLDLELCGELLVLVDINFDELHRPAMGPDRRLQKRPELLARAAPLGPKIHDDRVLKRGLEDIGHEARRIGLAHPSLFARRSGARARAHRLERARGAPPGAEAGAPPGARPAGGAVSGQLRKADEAGGFVVHVLIFLRVVQEAAALGPSCPQCILAPLFPSPLGGGMGSGGGAGESLFNGEKGGLGPRPVRAACLGEVGPSAAALPAESLRPDLGQCDGIQRRGKVGCDPDDQRSPPLMDSSEHRNARAEAGLKAVHHSAELAGGHPFNFPG